MTSPSGQRSLPAPPAIGDRPPEPFPRGRVSSIQMQPVSKPNPPILNGTGSSQAPLPLAERHSLLMTGNGHANARSNGAAAAGTSGGDNYNLAGHAAVAGGVAIPEGGESPSHPAYMEVLEAQIDGDQEAELYEDLDGMEIEGSYLTPAEVNCNFNLDMNNAYTIANEL